MVEKVNKFSPLTETTFYILLSLVDELHGYGIIKKVEEMTDSRIHLAAGTLYGALTTLQKNGLIIPKGEDNDNKRRKLYQITSIGKELIEYETVRLKEMIDNKIKELGGL
ncbi:PadR family transcriptional regulator [Mycoplasmatota bacterium WC44]